MEDLFHPATPKTNGEILRNLDSTLEHLIPQHSLDRKKLISENQTLFHDFPKKSGVLLHDIELVPGTTPIRQSAYRVGPGKKCQMK